MLLGIKGLRLESGRYFIVRREGKKLRRYPLTRQDEGEPALRIALRSIEGLQAPPTLVGDLLSRFVLDGLPELVSGGLLKQITADEYQRMIEATPDGLLDVFGKLKIDEIGSDDIAVHLEEGRRKGRAAAANRERSVFSKAFEWGRRQRGWRIRNNPCRGVTRNKERPSRRYVSTEELVETHDRASEALQLLINGAYLSGIRFTDLSLLRRTMILTLSMDGHAKNFIRWNESKTGKQNLMEIGPLLMEVFRRAIAYGDAIATKITKKLPVARPLPEWVFVNTRGKQWTQAALSSAMADAGATFAFRQIRPKTRTDEQNKNIIGHQGQLLESYTRVRKLKSMG